jgi:hypothetical protein
LGASLAGLTASPLFGADDLREILPKPRERFAFQPDTLFLTWQKDPTTTMTIQWIGSEATTDASIQYALTAQYALTGAAASVWQMAKTFTKPFSDTDLKVHRCELTGLASGAEYSFQIGKSSPLYRFRTMPAKATNTIQFVSGGDCGTNPHAINANILAAKQEPYFVLIGGDLAYDDGKTPETFLTFLRNYSKHMVDAKGRMIPMVSCIGNHEVKGGYEKKRENAPHYLSVFDGFYKETTYGVLDIGDYLSLVLMDTGHITPIKGEQTDWLGSTLANRQDRPHLIVVNHVPAYPSYRPPEGTDAKFGTGEMQRLHWCPLFEKFNVDVVLEHHDHTFKRTHPLKGGQKDKNGVLYLGDGSWGKLRVPKEPEKRPYLAAVGQSYHFTIHRLEENQRFHTALEESGKQVDVCMTAGKRPARRG